MNRTTYRPIRPTEQQKQNAMAFHAPHAAPLHATPQTDFERWSRSPEGQATLTAEVQEDLHHKTQFAAHEAQQERQAFLSDPDFQQDWAREEQRQLPAGTEHAFLLAGNATFTVVSKKTGSRFTFRVRRPKPDSPHFVTVLTGSDNEHSYTFLGTIFADGTYRHGRKSSISESAPSARAFAWFYGMLTSPERLAAQAEVWHEGRCCRCGRKLTVPSSIEAGIGPECAGKN